MDGIHKDCFTVITYTNQGLGHLRVSSALGHATPKDISPILYSPDEEFVTILHRLSSTNLLMRRVLLTIQKTSWLERPYTWFYRQYLRLGIISFEKKIDELFSRSTVKLDKVVFVTTHFGIAHQLSLIKKNFKCGEREGCKLILVVVVTDDSPQAPWFVPGADMIVVPSDSTKRKLLEIGGKSEDEFCIEVNPYPLNPILFGKLDKDKYIERINMSQDISKDINVSIPVSGAAVGTTFDEQLVRELNEGKYKFKFSVVSRDKPYAKKFLNNMTQLDNVDIFLSVEDLEVVEKYDKQFLEKTFLFEITKPSEQAFKALLHPQNVGGVVLLFQEPVGKQEIDNLKFLERHYMIPDREMTKMLYKKASEGKPPSKAMVNEAKYWRGVRLPRSPKEASRFIQWGLRNNIFSQMVKNGDRPAKLDSHKHELGVNGSETFWKLLDRFYEDKIE